MKITMEKYDSNFIWLNEYYFEKEDGFLCIKQIGSGDIYFLVYDYNNRNEFEIEINKNNYYELYKVFCSFFNNVVEEIKKNPYDFNMYNDLLQNNKLHFKSDAPIDEYAKEFKYCYFDIEKNDENIKMKIINPIKNDKYLYEINTDRSRYYGVRFHFVQLLLDLEDAVQPYLENDSEKYVYTKRK